MRKGFAAKVALHPARLLQRAMRRIPVISAYLWMLRFSPDLTAPLVGNACQQCMEEAQAGGGRAAGLSRTRMWASWVRAWRTCPGQLVGPTARIQSLLRDRPSSSGPSWPLFEDPCSEPHPPAATGLTCARPTAMGAKTQYSALDLPGFVFDLVSLPRYFLFNKPRLHW